MFDRPRHGRVTYANVTATLALFVALGGSSYAAIKITGRDVKDDSLTGRDVRSLTSRDVKDGTLRRADFRPGQLPEGEKFIVRTPGGSSHGDCFQNCEGVYVASAGARCADDERAVAGGASPAIDFTDKGYPGTNAVVVESRPLVRGEPPLPVGWLGTVRFTIEQSPASIPGDPGVYVICATGGA